MSTYKLVNESTGSGTELPAVTGSIGPAALDIGKLYRDTGCFTYDPGFMSTASCRSAITYIDGDAGVLMYRGYPIEQLAKQSSYLEVAYLLLHGELPNQAQFDAFDNEVTHHSMMHESIRHFLRGFHHDAHPMAMVCASIASLSAFYHDKIDIENPEHRRLAAVRLIAKMPTIAAACYRYSVGWPMRFPRNNLEYCTRFLHMMFEVPSEPLELSPTAAKALDLLFILHADHEQNASTSTVRLVGSTGANPYASVAAGIAALWGPAHGGANEAVLKMLEEIGDAKHVDSVVAKAKDKNSGFRLMGFGHRIYRAEDPRARVLRRTCSELGSPRFEAAEALEKAALAELHARRPDRVLATNVEFWSAVVLDLAEVTPDLFTPMFTCARVAGWSAHILEQKREAKLIRPTAKYVGHGPRSVAEVE